MFKNFLSNAFDFYFVAYVLFGLFILGIIILVYKLDYYGNTRFLNNIVLSERQQNFKGYVSVTDKRSLLNLVGVCVTDLRPSGTIKIGDKLVDVVTEGAFIERGSFVEIINVDNSRVLVRLIQ